MIKAVGNIFLYLLFLPVFLIKDVFISERTFLRKLAYFFLIIFLFGFTWLSGYGQLKSFVTYRLYQFGITDKLTKVKVLGDSMLPTIQNETEVQLNSPQKYGIERGDIVSFINLETGYLHYLKRVVGLPEETVSLKNGYVFINGKALQEDYVLTALPTFGNTFLGECESYTIPKDHFLVLGDNRTVSQDSRVIGFVSKKDIDGVIKEHLPEGFVAEQKQAEILKKEINPEAFLETSNKKRAEYESLPLMTNSSLNDLAKKRSEQIRDKFSDWKRQTISVEKLLEESGYSYNLVHEFVTFGYLNEQGIIDQIFESPIEKEYFLSNKYYEVGIGITERANQECTFPIISVIISWPSIPTYDQNVINIWENEVSVTNDLLAKLQGLIGTPGYDQEELRTLITKIAEQSEIATRVLNKMKAREWLSEKDNQDISRYTELVEETNRMLETLQKGTTGISLPSVPNQSTLPTSQSPSSTKFQTAGQKIVESGITATINKAWAEGNEIKIHITFGNNSSTAGSVSPIRVMIKSQSHGSGPNPAIPQLTLNAGEIRSFDFSYEKIPNPPYKWIYTNSAGESIELGSYTP